MPVIVSDVFLRGWLARQIFHSNLFIKKCKLNINILNIKKNSI
jgi:hypothetical protein